LTPSARPSRRSVRHQGHNYAAPGAYFVTVCVQHRRCLFGEIADGEMHLNAAGQMVHSSWEQLPERWPCLILDAFVVMPNHFHGILWIEEDGFGLINSDGKVVGQDGHADAPTLGEVVGGWKSLTTHRYIQGVRGAGWLPFAGRLWQRSFYDHIVRDEASFWTIQEYVATNPQRWEGDQLHPDNPSKW
jgi:putative transposase